MPRNPDKIDCSAGFPRGFERFTIVEDPRTGSHKKHHFGELIFIAVTALVCGVQSFSGMIEFAHLQQKWLSKWIKLPNGVPAKQTMINLFSVLDTSLFSQCVIEHVKDLYSELAQQLIAIDGKTIRGSVKSNSEQEYCLSAIKELFIVRSLISSILQKHKFSEKKANTGACMKMSKRPMAESAQEE